MKSSPRAELKGELLRHKSKVWQIARGIHFILHGWGKEIKDDCDIKKLNG